MYPEARRRVARMLNDLEAAEGQDPAEGLDGGGAVDPDMSVARLRWGCPPLPRVPQDRGSPFAASGSATDVVGNKGDGAAEGGDRDLCARSACLTAASSPPIVSSDDIIDLLTI